MRPPFILTAEQSTFAPSVRAAGPYTQMQQMRHAVARYAAMNIVTQLSAAKNERAILDSRPGLMPPRPSFGVLHVREDIDASTRSRDDSDDSDEPKSAQAREWRARKAGELGDVTLNGRLKLIARIPQDPAGEAAAP